MCSKKESEPQAILDAGYILGDGSFVTTDEFLNKVINVKEESKEKDVESKQIDTAQFDYEGVDNDVIAPPFDFNKMSQLMSISTSHTRCIDSKSMDIIGNGWSIVRDEDLKESECKEEDRDKLTKFFKHCNPDIPFEELLKRTLMDLNSIANANIEVARDMTGYPARLYHADTPNIRVLKKNKGYKQIVDNKKVYFQKFGQKIILDENGKVIDRNFINPATGKKIGTIKNSANEFLNFFTYYPGYKYYGVPMFIPAVKAIYGNSKVADYNIQFFDHNAVPQYAVIISGAKMTPDLRELIEYYFKHEIKGKAHKTLILPIPYKDVKIEFKALAIDTKEGSFHEYRKDNQDEILLAHGSFPGRIGIIETAHLGGGTGDDQNKNYQRGTINPLQLIVENKFNIFIKLGFGIKGWLFQFKDIDVFNEEKQSQIAERNLKNGSETVNEARQRVGRKPYEKGGDKPFIIVGNEIVFLEDLAREDEENKTYDKILSEYNSIIKELNKIRNNIKK